MQIRDEQEESILEEFRKINSKIVTEKGIDPDLLKSSTRIKGLNFLGFDESS